MRRNTILGTVLLVLVAIGVPATAVQAGPVGYTDAFTRLGQFATIPGTAWWVDPQTGGVVVSADRTVGPADLDIVSGTAHDVRATLIQDSGTLGRRIAGADPLFGPAAARCSVGFNARSLPTYYFITSGHCVGSVGGTAYADAAHSVTLGVVTAISPAYDYALVRYTNTRIAKPSSVNLYNGTYQAITSVSSGFVGQQVKRSGPTTGVHNGTITALNATVNYADGTVTGLIRTNVCSEPGDSGGPLFAGTIGIGVASGGSGNCASGGITYFAAAARAMTAYGISVY